MNNRLYRTADGRLMRLALDPATGVKARRNYRLRCGSTWEIVRVTGFADVEIGHGTEEFPRRTERWCRVRFADGGRVLVHPSHLEAIP